MMKPYVIEGVNPTTGRMVQMTVLAQDETEARRIAQHCGLEAVTVMLVREEEEI